MSAKEKVAETVRYCWNHTDSGKEEEMVLWMAEKLAASMRDRYVLPAGGGRVVDIDGTGRELVIRHRPA